jgi:putative ABC transport system permease protein
VTAFDYLRTALAAIRLNALRSLLTTLGVVIGVASVIVMAAVGSGARQQVDRLISNLGTNVLNVFPGSSRLGPRASGMGSALPFSESDLSAIRENVPGVVAISGEIRTAATLVYGNVNWLSNVNGVHADYLTIEGWSVAQGRPFTEAEIARGRKVALLGATVARQLFDGASPVGATVRIKNIPFLVIGVLAPTGRTMFGRDRDDVVLVPISTARSRLVGQEPVVPNQVATFQVKLADGVDLAAAEEEITRLLRQRRHVRPGAEDDFQVRNFAEMIQARTQTQTTLGWLLGATGAISLIVGGIGIMNIMLVSVTERTREIGLRMAVGARPRDILAQFLTEAVTLCLIGGLIGLVLGLAGAAAAAALAGWPVHVSPEIVVMALLSAGSVGVLFGFFPARRAAGLNPIDALRYE